MPKTIIIHGDAANFIPLFQGALVSVPPGKIKAKGKATYKGKKACVVGDEKSVKSKGSYMTPAYPIPGMGTAMIEKLDGTQKAKHTKTAGKLVIMKGALFKAKFKVLVPAMKIVPPGVPVPDNKKMYKGMGTFTSKNTHWKGT